MSLSDLLFGKKTAPKAAKMKYIPNDPRLEALLKQGQSGRLAANQFFTDEINVATRPNSHQFDKSRGIGEMQRRIGEAERQVLGGKEDQIRKVRELSAQRGLGNSSIGIGSVLGAEKRFGDELSQQKRILRGSQQDFIDQAKQKRLNRIFTAQQGMQGAMAGIPQLRTYMRAPAPEATRKGGLFNLIAPIAGGIMGAKSGGGAQGAAAGAQAGSGFASVLGSMA